MKPWIGQAIGDGGPSMVLVYVAVGVISSELPCMQNVSALLTVTLSCFRFLKIQAREYESIQAYQTYLCSPKTYWSVAQSRYIDDRPLLPPTKNPAHDLGTIFPRLVLLIMVDDAAVDQAGVKVQKCAGRLVSPLALKTLLDSLGLLLNRSVPTSTSVSSSVEVISGETPQVVLSRLQVLGDGCINGADKTFVQAGTPCEANLPHRYHQVFDSNFELKLARTPSGDKEDGKTSLALLRTFSFRCVFLGGVEKVRLAISCESASFHSVTIAVSPKRDALSRPD